MAKGKKHATNARRTSNRNQRATNEPNESDKELSPQAGVPLVPSGTCFMDLPAELRNNIYKITLLDGGPTIVLSGPVQPLQTYGDLSILPDWFRDHFRAMKPSARSPQHRTEWVVSPRQSLRNGIQWEGLFPPRPVPQGAGVRDYYCTYRLTCPQSTNIFLVSKQVRQEARGVLYTNDSFTFDVPWEDMCLAPLAFFSDQDSICSKIRFLELTFPMKPPFINETLRGIRVLAFGPPSQSQWNKLIKALNRLRLEELSIKVPDLDQWREGVPGLDRDRIRRITIKSLWKEGAV
ncbi:hypothetical protein P154DRAFT_248873 [Amniculicola lignicola CBS 123094]|uniref:Uncharacterized protein n=1 Tax=Amniculicola lignicola CBS 123094 TaxID=1392246 RepID=A0A6A5WCM9_9PLEO|nr:hypothetical protein P154DRAFT_248873 [Amniculicola lignicola CBS 123094]